MVIGILLAPEVHTCKGICPPFLELPKLPIRCRGGIVPAINTTQQAWVYHACVEGLNLAGGGHSGMCALAGVCACVERGEGAVAAYLKNCLGAQDGTSPQPLHESYK